MYDAHHQVVPLLLDDERSKETVDVVGPVCETSDCFAKDRSIQEVKQGEFIAIMSAGAYGKTMASRYNSRGLAAEVLVYGKQHALIFERESFDQIIALERIP
jgi:diaminopimelate decarboxylase